MLIDVLTLVVLAVFGIVLAWLLSENDGGPANPLRHIDPRNDVRYVWQYVLSSFHLGVAALGVVIMLGAGNINSGALSCVCVAVFPLLVACLGPLFISNMRRRYDAKRARSL